MKKTAIFIFAALLPILALAYSYPQSRTFVNSVVWTNELVNRIQITRATLTVSGSPTATVDIWVVNGIVSNNILHQFSTGFQLATVSSPTNAYLYTGDRIVARTSPTNRFTLVFDGNEAIVATGGTGNASWPLTNDVNAGLFGITNLTKIQANTVTATRVNAGHVEATTANFLAPAITGQSINGWSDIGSLLGTPINAVSTTGTDPTAPRGSITLSKSGATLLYIPYIRGINGTIVSNDANNNIVINGGNPTGTVAAFFPPSGTAGTGRVYYSLPASPNNYSFQDFKETDSNKYFVVNSAGTGIGFSTAIVTTVNATNVLTFGGRDTNFYMNAVNVTNFLSSDDGATITSYGSWIDAGSNMVAQYVTLTDANARVRTVMRLNAASGGSNAVLFSDNEFSGSNTFTKNVHARRYVTTGDNNSQGGAYSTVGNGTNNNTGGDFSANGGGRDNSVGGNSAANGGGQANSVGGTFAANAGGFQNSVAGLYAHNRGGRGNSAAGDYSDSGGYDVQISGANSFAHGQHLNITNANTWVFGTGQTETNRLQSQFDNAIIFDDWSATMRMGINTTAPTNALHVVGTVQADAFIGPFSATGVVRTVAAAGTTNDAPSGITFSNAVLHFVGADRISYITLPPIQMVVDGQSVTSTPNRLQLIGFTSVVSGTSVTYWPTNSGVTVGGTSTWAQVLLQGGPFAASVISNIPAQGITGSIPAAVITASVIATGSPNYGVQSETNYGGAVPASLLGNVPQTNQVNGLAGFGTNITLYGTTFIGTNRLDDSAGTNLLYNGLALRGGAGGVGSLTNIASSDGSIVIATPGGPQPSLSQQSTLTNANFAAGAVSNVSIANVSATKLVAGTIATAIDGSLITNLTPRGWTPTAVTRAPDTFYTNSSGKTMWFSTTVTGTAAVAGTVLARLVTSSNGVLQSLEFPGVGAGTIEVASPLSGFVLNGEIYYVTNLSSAGSTFILGNSKEWVDGGVATGGGGGGSGGWTNGWNVTCSLGKIFTNNVVGSMEWNGTNYNRGGAFVTNCVKNTVDGWISMACGLRVTQGDTVTFCRPLLYKNDVLLNWTESYVGGVNGNSGDTFFGFEGPTESTSIWKMAYYYFGSTTVALSGEPEANFWQGVVLK